MTTSQEWHYPHRQTSICSIFTNGGHLSIWFLAGFFLRPPKNQKICCFSLCRFRLGDNERLKSNWERDCVDVGDFFFLLFVSQQRATERLERVDDEWPYRPVIHRVLFFFSWWSYILKAGYCCQKRSRPSSSRTHNRAGMEPTERKERPAHGPPPTRQEIHRGGLFLIYLTSCWWCGRLFIYFWNR